MKKFKFEYLCNDCPEPHPAEKFILAGSDVDALKAFTWWFFDAENSGMDFSGYKVQGLRLSEEVDGDWWEVDSDDLGSLIDGCGLSGKYGKLGSDDDGLDQMLAEKAAERAAELRVAEINQYTELRISNYQGVKDLSNVLLNMLTPPDASIAVVPVKSGVGFDAIVRIEYKSEPYSLKRE